MRFFLAPNGSIGDLNPYLAIGAELRARGHHVTVLANDLFEPLVRQVGLDFAAVGRAEDLQRSWSHPDMWHPIRYSAHSLRDCALAPMRDVYEAIRQRYVPGETVVASPAWSFGARLAQERLGVPLATIHLEPFWIRSLYQSPHMPFPMMLGHGVPRLSKRFQFWIMDRWFVDPVIGPQTNAFRGQLGLPPLKRFLARWWHSPQRVIGLFPDWFGPPQPDWPPQTVLTGFVLWDQSRHQAIPDEVERFLAAGERPVVFTPGTAHRAAKPFFEAAIEACRVLSLRAILLAGDSSLLPPSLPGFAKHFQYVPFSGLLPRAAALVHHAGIGTAVQGLMAGLPQVLMPMAYDQPDTARRLERLGTAVTIPPRRFTAKRLARALQHLLASTEVANRCACWARTLEVEGPIRRAADALEELAGRDEEPRSGGA